MEEGIIKNGVRWAHVEVGETHGSSMQYGVRYICYQRYMRGSIVTFIRLVGKLRMCLMMVLSLETSGEALCNTSTYSCGNLSQAVHYNNNPTSTMMDLLMGDKVAMMNENEVQWIV
jgi:hypothetical protein